MLEAATARASSSTSCSCDQSADRQERLHRQTAPKSWRRPSPTRTRRTTPASWIRTGHARRAGPDNRGGLVRDGWQRGKAAGNVRKLQGRDRKPRGEIATAGQKKKDAKVAWKRAAVGETGVNGKTVQKKRSIERVTESCVSCCAVYGKFIIVFIGHH